MNMSNHFFTLFTQMTEVKRIAHVHLKKNQDGHWIAQTGKTFLVRRQFFLQLKFSLGASYSLICL